ncbi:NUDIX domain-containing protein [Neobacillus mesonae]|nr:NUDIX domain-containing protein [Neobacillus mesonae]
MSMLTNMEVRQMATAFLIHDDHFLMMKKAKSKIFNFEFWGGIGGHLEFEELNTPMNASYREIEEETGFIREDITEFRLRYILIEYCSGEIRQQYVYFGETKHRNFVPSDEGALYWIHKDQVLDLHTSTAVKSVLRHDQHDTTDHGVKVGIITVGEESASIVQWTELEETVSF